MNLTTGIPTARARSKAQPRNIRGVLKSILIGFTIVIVALITLGVLYQIVATRIDMNAYPPPGQLVDMGGYKLHLYCMGENRDASPTVILEQGLGLSSAGWARIQPELAGATRVCSYDRAGMAWSDRGPMPRDAQHIALELHQLLQKADVPGPYVLVGWSFGGLYVRAFQSQFPDQVAGIVLLDSSHPDQGKAQGASAARMYWIAPLLARLGIMRVMGLFQPDSGMPSPQKEQLGASFAATKTWDAASAEFFASFASYEQIRNLASLGNLPLYVLTATDHGTPAEQEVLWQNWQKELAALSTDSVHQIVNGAMHDSFGREPEVARTSVKAILHVVNAARTGQPLVSR